MIKTIEAVIDEHGQLRLLETVSLPSARRALVTILEEEPVAGISETARLAEPALAEDWKDRRRIQLGHTFSGCGSLGAISIFRLIAKELANVPADFILNALPRARELLVYKQPELFAK